MSGQGSTANVIAALASLIVPGVGQLIQGRIGKALFLFVLDSFVTLMSFGTLGWIIHIWAAIDAALWKPSYQY